MGPCDIITEFEDWRQLIIDCLNNVHYIEDEVSTARMVARARNYTLIEGILYKKGVVQPLLYNNPGVSHELSSEFGLK